MPLPLLLQRLQPTTLLAQASTASITAMPMQMLSPQCCRTTRPLLLLLELQLPLLKAVQSQQPQVWPSQRPSTTWDATTALELHLSVKFPLHSARAYWCVVLRVHSPVFKCCHAYCFSTHKFKPNSTVNFLQSKHLHTCWSCLKQEAS